MLATRPGDIIDSCAWRRVWNYGLRPNWPLETLLHQPAGAARLLTLSCCRNGKVGGGIGKPSWFHQRVCPLEAFLRARSACQRAVSCPDAPMKATHTPSFSNLSLARLAGSAVRSPDRPEFLVVHRAVRRSTTSHPAPALPSYGRLLGDCGAAPVAAYCWEPIPLSDGRRQASSRAVRTSPPLGAIIVAEELFTCCYQTPIPAECFDERAVWRVWLMDRNSHPRDARRCVAGDPPVCRRWRPMLLPFD